MGHTAYSLTAILSSFLGGLALGAWLAGRWTAGRVVSLRVYAALEVGVAAFGLLMPHLIRSYDPVFGVAYRALGDSLVAYNGVQLLMCGSLVLVPSALMGATLPVVVASLVARNEAFFRGTGLLYGLNTLGGALGAAAAGFWLLPRMGVPTTSLVAGGANLFVAGTAWNLARGLRWSQLAVDKQAVAKPVARRGGRRRLREVGMRQSHSPANDWAAPSPAWFVTLYGVAGFAALVLEVGWVRIVSLSIGSTNYGLTMTLVTYIVGLGLGSLVATQIGLFARRPVATFFWLNTTIAIAALASVPFLGRMPLQIVDWVAVHGGGFKSLLGWEFVLVGGSILVPTLAMGCLFPVACSVVHRAQEGAGRAVGTAYAANTVGNILGSLIAGFLLVPTVGMRATIVLAALLSALVAGATGVPGIRVRRRVAIAYSAGPILLVLAAATFLPRWELAVVTSGPYLRAKEWLQIARGNSQQDAVLRAMREHAGTIVDYREGAATVVSVERLGSDQYRLLTSGFVEAIGRHGVQVMLGHLPLLLHGNAQQVLVIGLGSGETLGTVLKHPVELAECVEISPEVRDMADRHFRPVHGDALNDPRTRLVIGDGRNHLRHSGRKYDVIISQPSMPWVSGAAGLFTREAFEEMGASLAPGGIACIWFQSHTPDCSDFRSLVRTWSGVFESCCLFESYGYDEFLLTGSVEPNRRIRAGAVAKAMAHPEVRRHLKEFDVLDVEDVLSFFYFGAAGMRRMGSGAALNSDDRAYIEFYSARGLLTTDNFGHYQQLETFREGVEGYLDASLPDPEAAERLAQRLGVNQRVKQLVHQARQLRPLHSISDRERWLQLLHESAGLNPRDPFVRHGRPMLKEAGKRDAEGEGTQGT
jgi:spermidine synthase